MTRAPRSPLPVHRIAPVLSVLFLLLAAGIHGLAARRASAAPPGAEESAGTGPGDYRDAWRRHPAPTVEEAGAFMKRLAAYVRDAHLKTDRSSPQAGMVYEYRNTRPRDPVERFVQGEALDTMHDGAWFAAALVHAVRTSGDDLYRELLFEWVLPFYVSTLNHSDELFTARHRYARPERRDVWSDSEIWLYQEGEKGFMPYWWDDGSSVSLERTRADPLPPFPCFDRFLHEERPNPRFRLDGYSLGCSNHMAQDLAVMLQQAWLLLGEEDGESGAELRDAVAEAAGNLHRSRMRHHGRIPMCVSAAALVTGDAGLMRHVPDPRSDRLELPRSAYYRALYDAGPGQRTGMPGFADDEEYRYYHGVARLGGELPRALAFELIYSALTTPLLWRIYCDDTEPPPGVHRFDLHPMHLVGGKPADYRSGRRGPGGGPRPFGSRLGPQNMVVCGWALQALDAFPGIWEERHRLRFPDDARVHIHDPVVEPGAEPERTRIDFGNAASVEVWSTRKAFLCRGEAGGDDATLRVLSRPGGKGRRLEVSLSADGDLEARNGRGDPVTVKGEVAPAGDGLRFRLSVPYTFIKGQALWANGVEHGRYTLELGGRRRNLYLASAESSVRAALERELGGGLRTWEAIFDEHGSIPTGVGAGSAGAGGKWPWEQLSDAGGCAHLVSAAAQWILYLEGRRDWEDLGVPIVGAAAEEAHRTRPGCIDAIPADDPEARDKRLALVRKRRGYTPVLVHRGATGFAPENTLAAFAAAMDRGADGFEIDIRRSRDGVLYVFHDETLDRVSDCSGEGRRKTYFELLGCSLGEGARIPTLAAVFTLARERAALLHLDVKEPGLEKGILRLIEAGDLWEHIVEVNPYNADSIRDHARIERLAYKGWFPREAARENPAAAGRFLEKPGSMVFTKVDPVDAVRALGRTGRDPRPVPPSLRVPWKPAGAVTKPARGGTSR